MPDQEQTGRSEPYNCSALTPVPTACAYCLGLDPCFVIIGSSPETVLSSPKARLTATLFMLGLLQKGRTAVL